MASLVAVLSIGDGMEAFVRGEIERTTARFSLADADSLATLLAGRARVAIGVTGAARASRTGLDTTAPAVVSATQPSAEERLRLVFAAGRFITERDLRDSARVAVLSNGLARTLAGGAARRRRSSGRKCSWRAAGSGWWAS